ncbi:MAG: type IIA DNA topoisomerase subunit B [Bacteroidales bacterium]|nr:type IIA DNA topoisomerase subunit B [Bacteroidales bacterium]
MAEELDDTIHDIPEDVQYIEDDIRTLDWRTHIRQRPGMYIGSLGDGSKADDGIYVLLKEVIDNSIDEFAMGYGKQITVDITEEGTVTVRDYGRGIPLGSVIKAVSTMNTSGKFDSKAFKKSVGLNGVGIKAVNALSSNFEIRSVRDGQVKSALFSQAELISDGEIESTEEPNGTMVRFTPDPEIFKGYQFNLDYVVEMMKNYSFLNTGLAMVLNGKKFVSKQGLLDLLKENMDKDPLYPIIHLKGDDIEVAITHVHQYGEEFYSFVNGQHTTQGGTHLVEFKKSVAQTIKDYFNKNFEFSDIRAGMVAAIAIKVQDPVFESQTKTKLGSRDMNADGLTVAKFIGDFVKKELDNYLHRNLDVADVILKQVQDSERARKAMAGLAKIAREKTKKVNLHNKKLLDCTIHLNDPKGKEDLREASSIFITEGDSAAGSITKIRDVKTQAVFSLRGKPLNAYGLTQKELVLNEEFNLLQAALNLQDGIEGLRYNNVIIATDADVDGMHIRLLLITFFLQFFPDLIKMGHVYVLQTPLFRVRSKKAQSRRKKDTDEVFYCYNDAERIAAIKHFGESDAEITRFKGLGEISPDEFRGFIGPDMRLDKVTLRKDDHVSTLLEFYMGKNTMERQNFIINNLVIEDDSQIS